MYINCKLVFISILFSLTTYSQSNDEHHPLSLSAGLSMEHQEWSLVPNLTLCYKFGPKYRVSGRMSYLPSNGSFFLYDLNLDLKMNRKAIDQAMYFTTGLNIFPGKSVKINNKRYLGHTLVGFNIGLEKIFSIKGKSFYGVFSGTVGQSWYHFFRAGIGMNFDIF